MYREFTDRDHEQAVVRVQTPRCFYSVAIRKRRDLLTVIGPGVNEDYTLSTWPAELSYEALALCAVLYFEEGE